MHTTCMYTCIHTWNIHVNVYEYLGRRNFVVKASVNFMIRNPCLVFDFWRENSLCTSFSDLYCAFSNFPATLIHPSQRCLVWLPTTIWKSKRAMIEGTCMGQKEMGSKSTNDLCWFKSDINQNHPRHFLTLRAEVARDIFLMTYLLVVAVNQG